MSRRRPLLPVLAAAALLAACGERSETPPAPRAPAPASPAAPALVLPPAGETRVERRGDRYDVAVSEAAPLDALTELSMRAGFRIERGSGPVSEAKRTLWLRDVSLERAVAAILVGLPHEVHHEFADGDLDPERPLEGRAVALTRVTLGAPGPGDEAAAPPGRGPGARSARRAREAKEERRGEGAPAEREGRPADADAREREDAEAIERDARDPDPDVRLGAVDRMDPEGADRALLERMLRDDASAEVRQAAAESLAEGNAFEVTPPLLGALADPDPGVVAAAVRGLEDVYDEAPDPRIRQKIAGLREHRDADVREAVEEFESWVAE